MDWRLLCFVCFHFSQLLIWGDSETQVQVLAHSISRHRITSGVESLSWICIFVLFFSSWNARCIIRNDKQIEFVTLTDLIQQADVDVTVQQHDQSKTGWPGFHQVRRPAGGAATHDRLGLMVAPSCRWTDESGWHIDWLARTTAAGNYPPLAESDGTGWKMYWSVWRLRKTEAPLDLPVGADDQNGGVARGQLVHTATPRWGVMRVERSLAWSC